MTLTADGRAELSWKSERGEESLLYMFTLKTLCLVMSVQKASFSNTATEVGDGMLLRWETTVRLWRKRERKSSDRNNKANFLVDSLNVENVYRN